MRRLTRKVRIVFLVAAVTCLLPRCAYLFSKIVPTGDSISGAISEPKPVTCYELDAQCIERAGAEQWCVVAGRHAKTDPRLGRLLEPCVAGTGRGRAAVDDRSRVDVAPIACEEDDRACFAGHPEIHTWRRVAGSDGHVCYLADEWTMDVLPLSPADWRRVRLYYLIHLQWGALRSSR